MCGSRERENVEKRGRFIESMLWDILNLFAARF